MQLGLYQHYKGGHYHVIAVCRNEASLEEMVLYRHLDGDYGLWVRNKAVFLEEIVFEGKTTPRFKFIKNLDVEAPAVHTEAPQYTMA